MVIGSTLVRRTLNSLFRVPCVMDINIYLIIAQGSTKVTKYETKTCWLYMNQTG